MRARTLQTASQCNNQEIGLRASPKRDRWVQRHIGNNSFTVVTILAALAALHIIYLSLPANAVPFFLRSRPALYLSVFIVLSIWLGKDERHIKKGRHSLLLSGIIAVFYLFLLFTTGILFGFGRNAMAPNIGSVFNNLWVYGACALFSEMIRFRLVRWMTLAQRAVGIGAVTLVFTFIQLDALKTVTFTNNGIHFLFASILPALMLNTVLTYVSTEGSLSSVLIIRGACQLCPYLLPALPNVSDLAWGIITEAVLFLSLWFYRKSMRVKSKKNRKAEKKRVKYQKKPYLLILSLAAFVILLVAFLSRVFVYYPVVILTNSMTGVIDQGAVVIVKKIRSEDVYGAVNQNDLIHFKQNKKEIIHRVTAFELDSQGRRIYITKGDANPINDSQPAEMDQILGIPQAYIPYIGYPAVIFRTLFG